MQTPSAELGWADDFDASWVDLGSPGRPGRVSRLDRGWSTVIRSMAEARGSAEPLRVRNIGADVAVGDWVVPSDDGERVEHVIERRSAFTRRASFDGMRAVSHTLAANIDVVFLVHALGSPPSPRRLERELVLAYDSGAEPVVVLTKTDLVDDPDEARAALVDVALGVPVLLASGKSREGLEAIRSRAVGNRTLTFLGASGVGKSTLVNALVPSAMRATGHVNEVTGRGRHTSSSTVSLRYRGDGGNGWVIDTPGVRSFGLGHVDPANILGAFTELAQIAQECPRGCTHLPDAPDCAIIEAAAEGRLGPNGAARLDSLQRLLLTFAGLH